MHKIYPESIIQPVNCLILNTNQAGSFFICQHQENTKFILILLPTTILFLDAFEGLFLCSKDKETGRNFDHRKQWLVDHMHHLTHFFAIKICAYAVMSNHYHLVLFVDKDLALSWPDEEVINRWAQLFPMSAAADWKHFNIDLNVLTEDQQQTLNTWRAQLFDMSWQILGRQV